MTSIVFITPDCSLTGAPVYLLNHLKYLKKTNNYILIVIFRNRIEKISLLNEFEKVASIFYWDDCMTFNLTRIKSIRKITTKVFNKSFFLRNFIFKAYYITFLKKYNISLIISNTSTIDAGILQIFKECSQSKLITIVHEGEKLLSYFNKDNTVENNLSLSDRIICVSHYLKNILSTKFKISKKIDVITGAAQKRHFLTETLLNPFLQYGIPDNAKIVLSCGWLSWHKGADLFIQSAIKILKTDKDVHFCWLGSPHEEELLSDFEFDVIKANIQSNVHFFKSTSEPYEYFRRADIFLMLSRNESFSLVTVEACLCKKPVLCFENSGGPPEIIGNDPELLIPYGDVDVLSEKIKELLESEEKRNLIGERLYKRVIKNYSYETTNEKFQELLKEYLNQDDNPNSF